ncbi:MAG TPA: amidohydrolase family protein [Burkholderiales bacterium]|nr:amidohydrolase family protein [Burkholderiales bacterium]
MRTVDIHAHWYPQEWLALFAKDGAAEGASLERAGERFMLRAKHITNAFDERFVVVDERVKAMDARRIDVHALSLTTPMVYWASAPLGLALSQAFNDAASAAHRKHPQRLVGLAMVPMQAPDLAVRELERSAKLPGIQGLYLATNVNGEELDERKFWDVYAKCEELGWAIFLHPVDTIGSDRTKKYYLKNLCGNPYDTGVAVAHLIFGGVMDRFPQLEVNLPHAGGTFPWLIGRWDHGAKVRPELKHMQQPPSSYLKRFTYDTIGHDDRINTNLVRLVGAERVTLGSDYCFDMGLDDPLATVNRIAGLSTEDKERICGGNALKLLQL